MYRVMLEHHVIPFINDLQKVPQTKFARLRKLLMEYGPDLGMPHSRQIRNQLFELRIRGSQEVRLFCTAKGHDIFIFYGFIKKTDRIPKRELETVLKIFNTFR